MRFYRDGEDWVFEDNEESFRFSGELLNKEGITLKDFLESVVDNILQGREEKLKKQANMDRLLKQQEIFDLLDDDRLELKTAEINNTMAAIQSRIENARTNLKNRIVEAWKNRINSQEEPGNNSGNNE